MMRDPQLHRHDIIPVLREPTTDVSPVIRESTSDVSSVLSNPPLASVQTSQPLTSSQCHVSQTLTSVLSESATSISANEPAIDINATSAKHRRQLSSIESATEISAKRVNII